MRPRDSAASRRGAGEATPDRRRARPAGRPLTPPLLALALVGALGGRVDAAAQETAPASRAEPDRPRALVEIALERVEELQARRVEGLSPIDVMLRNLSRYFVTYPVPAEGAALGQLFTATEELTRRYAWLVIDTAARGPAAPAGGAVEAAAIDAAARRLLPRRDTAYDETLFFPEAAPAESTLIERWDLEAFAATGFGWQALLGLDRAPGGGPVPAVDGAAADRLAAEAEAFGLLLLRRAGHRAQRARVPELGVDQLRDAAVDLEQRIGRRAAGAPDPPVAATPPPAPAQGLPFTDVTAASGIAFRHVSSDWLGRWRRFGPLAPSFGGGGVTAGDLDGDGWADLLFCGGAGCRAFRNRGDGTFADVTDRLGIGAACEARMALLADLDDDGWRDLFVTCARDSNRLYRGRPDGTFDDVTAGSGLESEGNISGPAAAFDADRDGRLDLYLGSFGNYLAGESPFRPGDNKNGQPDRLYRNLGGLVFADVSAEAGVGNTGWTQAVGHADVDRDGDPDVYVANDFGRNDLLLNDGAGRFSSAGALTGSDDPFHGMNVAFADLNGDLLPDLYVTNIWNLDRRRLELIESNSLLLSRDGGERPRWQRVDDAVTAAVDTGWSWGALFFDLEQDGDDDLFVVGGFTDYWTSIQFRRHPERAEAYPISNGREPNRLFLNADGLPAESVPSGAELADANSRGLALLDYDRDGDPDLAISTFHGPAHLFRNDAAKRGGWLDLELAGAGGREAIGAEAVIRLAGGGTVWRQVSGGEGYLSMSARPLHVGLGDAATATVEVRWPGGARTRLHDLPAGRHVRVEAR